MASSDPQVERDVVSSGYESPNETNQSSYFPSSTTGAAAVANAAPSPGTPNASQRQRPSMPPGSGSRGQVEANIPRMRPQGSNGSSLNRMLAANQNQTSPSGKVSLRDRIACHQWTWFAMVSISKEIDGFRLTWNRQWCANPAAVHRASRSNDCFRQPAALRMCCTHVRAGDSLGLPDQSDIRSIVSRSLARWSGRRHFSLQHLSFHYELRLDIYPVPSTTGLFHERLYRPDGVSIHPIFRKSYHPIAKTCYLD